MVVNSSYLTLSYHGKSYIIYFRQKKNISLHEQKEREQKREKAGAEVNPAIQLII